MGFLIELLFSLVFRIPLLRMIILAVVPALALLLYVRRKDRLEAEPPELIWSLVGLGVVSVLIAFIVELAGLAALKALFRDQHLLFQILHWYLVVGIGEELSKYVVLRARTWKDPHFNCLFDGMVYAVAVSAGFALAENIVYAFRYGAGVLMARGLVSIPAHISFSVFMGAWYSAAKRYAMAGETQKAKRCHALAVLVPAIAHGTFDLMASNTQSTGMIIAFVIFIILMFVIAWRMLKSLADRDTYLESRTPVEGIFHN